VVTQQDDYQNPVEPTLTQTFSLYGITAFDVQYWNGSTWVTVPNGSITDNNKVWRQFTFSSITTSKIRVVVNAGADNVYSRVVEVEAWTASGSTTNINWLVMDQLGTPRMVFDQTGALATVKRHDYLPFGEEIFAGTAGRTTTQGYARQTVRQMACGKSSPQKNGMLKPTGLLNKSLLLINAGKVHFSRSVGSKCNRFRSPIVQSIHIRTQQSA